MIKSHLIFWFLADTTDLDEFEYAGDVWSLFFMILACKEECPDLQGLEVLHHSLVQPGKGRCEIFCLLPLELVSPLETEVAGQPRNDASLLMPGKVLT